MAINSSSTPLSAFSHNEATMFAEVIIPLSLPKNYTWSVPFEMQASIKPGIRVEVILGKHKNMPE